MRTNYFSNFHDAIVKAQFDLETYGEDVDPGSWQGVPTEGHPDMGTRELTDVHFTVPMPGESWTPLGELVDQINPNMPWADDHFEERVSRDPSNPGEQYKNWPWWRGQELAFEQPGSGHDEVVTEIFSHTYQERFWPKHAGKSYREVPLTGFMEDEGRTRFEESPMRGIRYPYGDLDDVVGQLLEYPYGRQAYFPIFFPEDTGNVHRGRVPCSLGYFFLLRNSQLHMWYTIRSCDFVRHFRDDLYLAARLQLWVLNECKTRSRSENERAVGDAYSANEVKAAEQSQMWRDVTPGLFHFDCFSLHYHRGDEHLVRPAN